MKKYTKKIKQLLLLIGKSKWVYIGALTAIAGEVAAESAGNLIIRHLIDNVIIGNQGMAAIILFTFIFGGISLFRALFSFLEGRGKAKVSESVAKNIRNQMYDHIQHLSFQCHDKAQTGELVQRATSDVDAVRRFFAEQVPGIARTGLLAFTAPPRIGAVPTTVPPPHSLPTLPGARSWGECILPHKLSFSTLTRCFTLLIIP